MRILTVEALRRLAAEQEPPCLSLYMPTHRTHLGASEDRIRYKNLVAKASRLLETSYSQRQVKPLLERLERLTNGEFWNRQQDGLAVFASNARLDEYRLPMALPELVVASDSFHLRPLLRYLQSNEGYFLLAVSQNHVALHRGGREGLAPVEVEGLPKSLVDALGPEQAEAFLNYRSNVTKQGEGAVFHGHGSGKEPNDEDLLRYFRVIDEALWKVLREEKDPLVLALPKSYHPLYRSVTRYQHLAAEGLNGNFDRGRAEEMHREAWPIVERQVERRVEQVLEAYGNAAPRGRATSDLASIGLQAVQGRVQELLVAENSHLWGVLDRTSGRVDVRERQQDAHDDDVIDDLAETVLLRGGGVLTVKPARMPNGSPVAALLRW